jgi:signal transduction histidine kinase
VKKRITAAIVGHLLGKPLDDLSDAVRRYVPGSPLEKAGVSGIREIDSLFDALREASHRVALSVTMERRFSADVSHQLRTPLTSLRLRIENAHNVHASPELVGALDDLERLEQTVVFLLAHARDLHPEPRPVLLDHALGRATGRWVHQVEATGRTLVVVPGQQLAAVGSCLGVDQVVDILVENALRHGRGTVTLSARSLFGGSAIDVSDEGTSLSGQDAMRIFRWGEGDGHGLGLAIARRLAEADGGRLALVNRAPTTFSLVLLEPLVQPDDDVHALDISSGSWTWTALTLQ